MAVYWSSDEEFEVEKILDMRINSQVSSSRHLTTSYFLLKNKPEFYIKWKGYSAFVNSWEPQENLSGCQDLVEEFMWSRKLMPNGLVSKENVKAKRKIPKIIDLSSVNDLNSCEDTDAILEVKRPNIQLSNQEMIFLKGMTEFQNMLDAVPGAVIRVSNSINLEPPPSDFVYITSFLYGHNVPKPDPAFLTGCECQDGLCKSKNCFCVNQNSEHPKKHSGNYTHDGRLKSIVSGDLHKRQPFIYECNERCSCKESNKCLNRVIQNGRTVPLEIFFLGDSRGWGVRAIQMIPAGTFVDLYHGEIITDEEADERFHSLYKGDWRSLYLFDLDFSAEAGTKADYTVDAYHYGSVSRFFNHNCNPNLLVAPCFIDHIDQSLHFIAFFAARDIQPDEELCFDYTNERGRATGLHSKKSDSVKYDSGIIKCLCGAQNCRQYIYPLSNKS